MTWTEHDVQRQNYRINKLLCWHDRKNLKLLFSNNGVVSYCGICFRKHDGIHDFGRHEYR
jgi:hypothetical protein